MRPPLLSSLSRAVFALGVVLLFAASMLPAEAAVEPPSPTGQRPQGQTNQTGKPVTSPPAASKQPLSKETAAKKAEAARKEAQEAKQKAAEAKQKGQESKAKAEEARAKASEAREKAETARAKAEEAKAKVQEARAKGEKFFDIFPDYRKATQERADSLQEQSQSAKERTASAKSNLEEAKQKLGKSPGDSKTRGEALAAFRDAQAAAAEQLRTAAERMAATVEQVAAQGSGTEVLLTNVGGDPDRPIILGNLSNAETESPVQETESLAQEIATQSLPTEPDSQTYEAKKKQLQESLGKLKGKYAELKVNHSKRSCDVQVAALGQVAGKLGDSAAKSALSKVQEKCGQIRDEKSAESTAKETQTELEGIRASLKNSLALAVKAGSGPDIRSDNVTATSAPRVTTGPAATAALSSPDVASYIASHTDLEVTGMEVSQGIQNLNNNMPLVDGRRTIVRVYVKNSDIATSVSGVNARLYGTQGGRLLSDSPLEAENNPITVKRDGGQRVNLDDSFWFVLPEEWTSGTIGLTAQVNYDKNVSESDYYLKNYKTVSATFHKAENFNMVIVPLHVHTVDNPSGAWDSYRVFQGDESYRWDIYNNVYRFHPIAHLGSEETSTVWKFSSTYLVPDDHRGGDEEWDLTDDEGDTEDDDDWIEMLNAVRDFNSLTEDWVDDLHYVGAIHKDVPTDWAGYAKLTSLDSVVEMGDGSTSSPTQYVYGGGTLAHELGHNAGRKHVECKGNEEEGGAVDSNYPYPYPNCQLAKVDTAGYYGLDVYYGKFDLNEPAVISNDPGASSSNLGFPTMGYQSPKYTDPYTYCALLNQYGVTCGLSFSPPAAPSPLPSADPSRLQALKGTRLVIVQGVLDLEKSSGRFTQVRLQDSRNVFRDDMALAEKRLQHLAAGEGSRFSIDVQDSSGKSLYTLPILLDETPHGKYRHSAFHETVPWSDKAARVVLKYNDKTLVTKSPSAGAPSVTLLSPNGGEKPGRDITVKWKASDPDGDSLKFHILYSTDGGLKWKAVARGVSGSEYRLENPPPGSARAKFRVVASDGFHTAQDDSDGVFTVSGSAPSVVIHSPKDGKTLLGKRALLLDGSAEDPEDGALKKRSLVWTSDKAGVLGYGSEVRVNLTKLDSGKHTITLTATDSDGMKGTASVAVTIGAAGARGSVAVAGSGQK